MPIDSSSRRMRRRAAACSRSRSVRKAAKSRRACVVAAFQAGNAHQAADFDMLQCHQLGSSGSTLAGRSRAWPPRRRRSLPAAPACGGPPRRPRIDGLGQAETVDRLDHLTSGSVRSTLLRCKCPIMCQRMGRVGQRGGRSQSCCGRLSPKSVQPAATRARISSGPAYFVTATSRTASCGRPGRRTAMRRPHAAVSRSRPQFRLAIWAHQLYPAHSVCRRGSSAHGVCRIRPHSLSTRTIARDGVGHHQARAAPPGQPGNVARPVDGNHLQLFHQLGIEPAEEIDAVRIEARANCIAGSGVAGDSRGGSAAGPPRARARRPAAARPVPARRPIRSRRRSPRRLPPAGRRFPARGRGSPRSDAAGRLRSPRRPVRPAAATGQVQAVAVQLAAALPHRVALPGQHVQDGVARPPARSAR